VFTSDADYQAYEARVVSTSDAVEGSGTVIESGTGGLAGVQRTITITDAELEAAAAAEGSNIIKIFVQNTAGVWSA
jgi:hypothetical protein